MEVFLLNKFFETFDVIDNCIKLNLTKRYFSPGDFTMTLYGDYGKLRSAAALYEPLSKSTFLIEKIEYGGEGMITVSGRSLEALLEWRVLSAKGKYSGNVEDVVRLAVASNTSGERGILRLALGDTAGIEGIGSFETGRRNLSEFVYETLRPYGASYAVELDGNVPVFKVIRGKNRTRDQKFLTPIVFSESMGNVADGKLTFDMTEYRNTAVVMGGDNRSVTVCLDTSPYDRREVTVYASDITLDDFDSDEEYVSALTARGKEMLAECESVWKYTGCAVGDFVFGEDYYLGDVCDIDTDFGVSVSERVTSVRYDFDGGNVRVTPSFGEREVTLSSLVKDIVKTVN